MIHINKINNLLYKIEEQTKAVDTLQKLKCKCETYDREVETLKELIKELEVVTNVK